MKEYRFRIARVEDKPALIEFLDAEWGSKHPLVHIPEFFDYYYKGPDGRLNFALAERDGKLCAVAGFIPASIKIRPDIWVSIWVANKAAKGCGLELMAALPELTNCRVMSCNNIRPETRLFYDFLGFTSCRMGHYYRLADLEEYTIAKIKNKLILPVAGEAQLVPYPTLEALEASGFIPPLDAKPYKDLWYIGRRYYGYPGQKYMVMGVLMPGEHLPKALICARRIEVDGTNVLRIADFIGDPALLPETGAALDGLMRGIGAEYMDFYCAGVEPSLLAHAGFVRRTKQDENIIPNYLTPPVYENTDYYYFTSDTTGFTMFKADGDQDRPNLPIP